MSAKVDRLVETLREFLEAATAKEPDETTLINATQIIAQTLGDWGLKPGDMIRLSNGTIYHEEAAFFRNNQYQPNNIDDGKLFCRNTRSLDKADTVISDAEAYRVRGDGIGVPNVWDERVRESASIEDRKAFMRELPELASKLRALALRRHDPELAKAAKLAQRFSDIIAAEADSPSL